MVDHLTRWPIAKPIPDKEATTVANAIFKKFILEHGTPEVLLSDNGKEFTIDTLAYVYGEVPYTLLYNRDPSLPVQKLIKCTEPYKGDNTLGKRIEQS